jgi:hypothetical protein
MNPNRQQVGTASVKRKLGEANMYGNDQPQYAAPAKMALQPSGKISINRKQNIYTSFLF